jgi:hypothetical protein
MCAVVVSWRTSSTLEAIHAREMLQEALARHGAPEIVNTDQGIQFTTQKFLDIVLTAKTQLSLPAASTGTTVNAATLVMRGKHRMKFSSRACASSKRLRKMKVTGTPRVGHRQAEYIQTRCPIPWPSFEWCRLCSAARCHIESPVVCRTRSDGYLVAAPKAQASAVPSVS